MKNRFEKVTATLKAEKNIRKFINQCFAIILNMQDNILFKKPPVSYSDALKAIKELEIAEFETFMRTAGAAQKRDKQKENVMKFIRRLHLFVQELADDAATEKKAKELVKASGFSIKKNRFYLKPFFTVKQDMISGNLILRVKSAGKRATYEWQVSTDEGENFVYMTSTLKAGTVVCNAAPYQKIIFRFRSLNNTGFSEWSDPKMIIPIETNVVFVMPKKNK